MPTIAAVAVMAALVALHAWGQPGPAAGAAPTPSPGSSPVAVPDKGPQTALANPEWLQKNLRDPRWPEALAAFVRQTAGIDRIREALEPVKELPEGLPAGLALEVGGLLEVVGSPEAALRYYGHAARKAASPAARTTALLASAALACDLGEDEKALRDLEEAVAGLPPGTLRHEVATAQLLLRLEVSPDQQTLRELNRAAETLPPESLARLYALLALADHAQAAGETADLARYRSQMEQGFGRSPEAALASGSPSVTRAFSPRYLFRGSSDREQPVAAPPQGAPALPPQAQPRGVAPQATPAAPTISSPLPVRIQTGSFTVAENASFMARDLAAAGFPTKTEKTVLSGRTYYRVFLSSALTAEEARTTLIRLKEVGFEGVLVP